jgi:hypothetical protein
MHHPSPYTGGWVGTTDRTTADITDMQHSSNRRSTHSDRQTEPCAAPYFDVTVLVLILHSPGRRRASAAQHSTAGKTRLVKMDPQLRLVCGRLTRCEACSATRQSAPLRIKNQGSLMKRIVTPQPQRLRGTREHLSCLFSQHEHEKGRPSDLWARPRPNFLINVSTSRDKMCGCSHGEQQPKPDHASVVMHVRHNGQWSVCAVEKKGKRFKTRWPWNGSVCFIAAERVCSTRGCTRVASARSRVLKAHVPLKLQPSRVAESGVPPPPSRVLSKLFTGRGKNHHFRPPTAYQTNSVVNLAAIQTLQP